VIATVGAGALFPSRLVPALLAGHPDADAVERSIGEAAPDG